MKNYNDWNTQKKILLEYMQVMIALEDWHGVADAAMDIRELQAAAIGFRAPSQLAAEAAIETDKGKM